MNSPVLTFIIAMQGKIVKKFIKNNAIDSESAVSLKEINVSYNLAFKKLSAQNIILEKNDKYFVNIAKLEKKSNLEKIYR